MKYCLRKLRGIEQRDTDTCEKLLREQRLFGTYDEEIQQVHREDAAELAGVVSRYGWPGISKVGVAGCRTARIIAQNSICTTDLQRGFLRALEEAAKSGNVPMRQVAMLTDRISFNEGRPQIYGTF